MVRSSPESRREQTQVLQEVLAEPFSVTVAQGGAAGVSELIDGDPQDAPEPLLSFSESVVYGRSGNPKAADRQDFLAYVR